MDWTELFEEAGLSDREAKSLVILSSSKELKASDLAKKLGTNRLDAYNSLSRLTQIGLVNVCSRIGRSRILRRKNVHEKIENWRNG